LSPTRHPKSASPKRQPPFKAGAADQSIISRRDFGSSRRARHRTPLPAEGDPSKLTMVAHNYSYYDLYFVKRVLLRKTFKKDGVSMALRLF